MEIPAYPSRRDVPDIDQDTVRPARPLLAILAGFAHNRRVIAPAITAPANRPNRAGGRRASIGRACASISISHIKAASA